MRAATDGLGATITFDTTGVKALILKGIEFTRNLGKFIQVGSTPLDMTLDLPTFEFMVSGRQYIGAVEGDATPFRYVPQMIQWYREGKFPIDRLVKYFSADDFETALKEMHNGETIKPVLVW